MRLPLLIPIPPPCTMMSRMPPFLWMYPPVLMTLRKIHLNTYIPSWIRVSVTVSFLPLMPPLEWSPLIILSPIMKTPKMN